MKMRSGRVLSFWEGLTRASVAPVRVAASLAPLLRQATAEELDRVLGDGNSSASDEQDNSHEDDTFLMPSGDFPAAGAEEAVAIVPGPSKKRKNGKAHDKRQEARDAAILEEGHRLPPALHAHFLSIVDRVAAEEYTAQSMPFAKNAYTAKRSVVVDSRKACSPAFLVSLGMRGIDYQAGFLRPVVDQDDIVVACFVDKPRDHADVPPERQWDNALYSVFDAFCAEADDANLKATPHTRGPHIAINAGRSVAPGSATVANVKLGPCGKLIRRLMGNTAVERMAVYQSAAFELWAPRLHAEYFQYSKKVDKKFPDVPRNWRKSVFPMACFNMGRNVVCFRHRDIMNVPYGWCAITALGRFNSKKSAYLVLWELGLFFEFPHGTTMYIPSACITHSNTQLVGSQEARASFTQYFPGFLLRFVDNDFITDKELKAHNPSKFKDLAAWKNDRWERGLGKLSTFQEVMDRLSS